MSKINRQDRFRFRAWCDYTSGDHMSSQAGKKYMIDSDALENDPELTMMLKDEIDCVLMQCTGLRDKNGVLIWEKDIAISKDGVRGIVEYRQDVAAFVFVENIGGWDSIEVVSEVIGNIYQDSHLLNPELLEQ